MSSYLSNRGGVQVYRRFCFGAILSGILCLGVVAIFVLLFFQPIFWLQQVDAEGEILNEWQWTGLDFTYSVLRRWFPQDKEQFNLLNTYVADYAGDNTLYMFVRNFAMYIEILILAFLALATVFAVFVGICGILYVFTGRNTNTKLASSLSKSALVFYALFVGLVLLFAYIVQNMVMDPTGPQDAAVRFAVLPLIMAGVLLAIVIALAITYHLAFKDKVFMSRKKSSNNDEEDDVEEFNPRQYQAPQNQQYQQGQTVIIQQQAAATDSGRLPEGVREIGDHAFAKNLSLKEATIPYGVPGLGPSAFSNCLALEKVIIPFSVKDIGYNCFFNTPKLRKIVYLGTVKDWKRVKRGSNWLARSGTRVIEASDGRIVVYR